MLDQVAAFRCGELDLTHLVAGLRAEYVEADPHNAKVRTEFESKWVAMDAENELRTEPWAPRDAASDDRLSEALDAFCSWVQQLLTADSSSQHR